MDLLNIAQTLYGCIRQHYPQIAGGALQAIGIATILYRILASQKVGTTPQSGLGMGRLLTILGRVAMNK